MPKKSTSLMGSGPEGNTHIFANGGQVRYDLGTREVLVTGVRIFPLTWVVYKTRDVSGLPVYSISTTWTQDPVFFTNDGKSKVLLALEEQENFAGQEWHITSTGEQDEYYIWQYDRAQSSKAYLSAPNGLFSSVIFTTKPLTKFRIVVQSNDEN